jgi:DNA-binding ferritin-like protein
MSNKVEQSDVEEITHMIEAIAERANQIKGKAFTLRQIQKPDDAPEKTPEGGDFASDIKRRLGRIQNILDDANESLGRFAG